MKTHCFIVAVQARDTVQPEAVRLALTMLLDAGLADAHATIEHGDGEIELAKLAVDLNISSPSAMDMEIAHLFDVRDAALMSTMHEAEKVVHLRLLLEETVEYLRGIREETLDGSEPALKELLDRAGAAMKHKRSVETALPADQDEPILYPFRVTYHEESGDKMAMAYDCMAMDADNAAELCEKNHPGCRVVNCTEFSGNLPLDSWLRQLHEGDQVWWNDPDHGISSGYYRIDIVNGTWVDSDDSILMLKNEAGSQTEVYAHELSPSQPEGLYPVVDGDAGDGDLYGYADSKETAIDVGNSSFADEVVDAYLTENVVLVSGEKLPKAWVVLTSKLSESTRVRLVLNVDYDLNGVDPEEMASRLRGMVYCAIGEGLLTGDTSATVSAYTVDTMVVEDTSALAAEAEAELTL